MVSLEHVGWWWWCLMFCFLDLIVYQAATTLAKRWQCAVKKDLDKTPRLKELCKFVMESRALRRQESAEKSLPKGTGAVDGEGGGRQRRRRRSSIQRRK